MVPERLVDYDCSPGSTKGRISNPQAAVKISPATAVYSTAFHPSGHPHIRATPTPSRSWHAKEEEELSPLPSFSPFLSSSLMSATKKRERERAFTSFSSAGSMSSVSDTEAESVCSRGLLRTHEIPPLRRRKGQKKLGSLPKVA
ncbi:hypothetical protein BHM03_00016484 [Ensete ventricosum]|nr:hypothetical protein BHM03_00016484 [Ensete ventricosum]